LFVVGLLAGCLFPARVDEDDDDVDDDVDDDDNELA
jgi:hypothetical protein